MLSIASPRGAAWIGNRTNEALLYEVLYGGQQVIWGHSLIRTHTQQQIGYSRGRTCSWLCPMSIMLEAIPALDPFNEPPVNKGET